MCIEPVVQLVWRPLCSPTLPNEDSTLVEFDEGNLFALNRFPGSDARERGASVPIWALAGPAMTPSGWTSAPPWAGCLRTMISASSAQPPGWTGSTSDWLAAIAADLAPGLRLTNRMLFDDGFRRDQGRDAP